MKRRIFLRCATISWAVFTVGCGSGFLRKDKKGGHQSLNGSNFANDPYNPYNPYNSGKNKDSNPYGSNPYQQAGGGSQNPYHTPYYWGGNNGGYYPY